MENFDAFSGGIEPGGLRTKSEIKTLICYMIRVLDCALSKEQVHDIMQSQGLANYFDVSEALGDLIQNGIIRTVSQTDGSERLQITLEGSSSLASIENYLPRTVKEKAVNEGVRLTTIARNAGVTNTEIEPCGNGYNVSFSIFDKDDVLMSMKLYVADFGQAKTVQNRFLEDPVAFYSSIISKLY